MQMLMHSHKDYTFGDYVLVASCLNSSLQAPDIVDGELCLGVLSTCINETCVYNV